MHVVTEVSEAHAALTEDDVDTMIGAIRAGAAASFLLLVISAVSLVTGGFALDTQGNPVAAAWLVIEMLVYATCAVLVWYLLRFGTVLLYVFCLGKLTLFLVGHEYVGLTVGALLLFVIHRSGLNAFRLHRLLHAARVAPVDRRA